MNLWFYILSQASAGTELIYQQGTQQKGDEPDNVWCSRPSRCACAAPQTVWHGFMYMIIFVSLILGILIVTDAGEPKHTDDNSPL